MVVQSAILPSTPHLDHIANKKLCLMIQLYQLLRVYWKDIMEQYLHMDRQVQERLIRCKEANKNNN